MKKEREGEVGVRGGTVTVIEPPVSLRGFTALPLSSCRHPALHPLHLPLSWPFERGMRKDGFSLIAANQ